MVWASLGLAGIVVAIVAALNLAFSHHGLSPVTLPAWFPLADADHKIHFLMCFGGVAAGCLSLQRLYAQTVHANER
jgi:hypothetical protein